MGVLDLKAAQLIFSFNPGGHPAFESENGSLVEQFGHTWGPVCFGDNHPVHLDGLFTRNPLKEVLRKQDQCVTSRLVGRWQEAVGGYNALTFISKNR